MTRVVTLLHGTGLSSDAVRVERTATRAVAVRGDLVLLLRGRAGDYRFPGGGVDDGESVEQSLRRELLEECGTGLVAVVEPLITVVDERPAREPGCVFSHASHYWLVDTDDAIGDVDHDLRETNLGLTPGWVPLADAMAANQELRRSRRSEEPTARADSADAPDPFAWIERETLVLELLAEAEPSPTS